MGRKSKSQLADQAWSDQLDRQAREGKVDAVFQDLLDHRDEPWNEPERLKALDKAVKAAGDKGPSAVIDEMFSRMLQTLLRVQLQQELVTNQFLPKWDKGRAVGDIEHLQTYELPALDQIYRRGCEIAKTYATLKHALGLADRSGDEHIREKILKIARETEAGDQPEARVG